MLVQLFLKLTQKAKVKPAKWQGQKRRRRRKQRTKHRSHLSRRQRKKKLLLAVSWISIFENPLVWFLVRDCWDFFVFLFFYSVATPGTDLKREYNNCTCAMDLPKGVSSKCFSFFPFVGLLLLEEMSFAPSSTL